MFLLDDKRLLQAPGMQVDANYLHRKSWKMTSPVNDSSVSKSYPLHPNRDFWVMQWKGRREPPAP